MKICIVTGSRSEYFLLRNLILKLKKDNFFKIKIIVTGSHNSKALGQTIKDIKRDKIKITNNIKLPIQKDNEAGLTKSIANGIEKISDSLRKIKPDLVLILGDRYEIFSAAIAAYINKIPLAHIHGGEKTEGSMDDCFRHSITKLSNLHFASNKESYNRILQLGEETKNVHLVGSLGVEASKKIKYLNKIEIEKKINVKFKKKIILVNFHPETLDKPTKKNKFQIIIKVLKELENDYTIIFTAPNADVGYKNIIKEIKNFIKRKNNSYFIKSLGQQLLFSLYRQINFMIGNSSSGIIELPTFKKPTINVGNRQRGRLKTTSILDVNYDKSTILNKIKYINSKKFLRKISNTQNPYDFGLTSKKIFIKLKKLDIKKLTFKKFKDYPILK